MSFHQILLKIVLLESIGRGKTTSLVQFVDAKFISTLKALIGVAFSLKSIDIDFGPNHEKVKILAQIWDINNTQKYGNILPYYFIDVQGIILVFDSTFPGSLRFLHTKLESIGEKYFPQTLPKVLISVKYNPTDTSAINYLDLATFMNIHHINHYYPINTNDGEHIMMLSLSALAEQILFPQLLFSY